MNKAMHSPTWARALVFALSTTLVLSGCTTMTSVPIPAAPSRAIRIHVGDNVRIVTRDGRRLDFRVTQVDAEGLAGPHVRVTYPEMAAIQHRQLAKGRTTLLVTGIVVGIVVVAGAIVLASSGFAVMPSGAP